MFIKREAPQCFSFFMSGTFFYTEWKFAIDPRSFGGLNDFQLVINPV